MIRYIVLLALLLQPGGSRAADIKPEVAGDDGKRAFDDLARYYGDPEKVPAFKDALKELKSPDAAVRRKAGQYLFALLKQSFADEDNGRAVWQKQPFFGGGSRNPSREFRLQLSELIGKEAESEEALDAALWLLHGERHPKGLKAGIDVLRRIQGAKAGEALQGLLTVPHPAEEVLTGAVAEVGVRGLKAAGPAVMALSHHHRKAVRDAVRASSEKLKLGPVPAFDPAKAFSPSLEKSLREVSAMIPTAVPKDSRWVTFEQKEDDETQRTQGWLLSSTKEEHRFLDWFGQIRKLPVKGTTVKDGSLADAAKRFKTIRGGEERDALAELSPRGMLTMQFQPRALSQPELLVAAWAFERGERKTCAEALFERLDELADDRFMVEIARDLMGHQYHQRMLELFSYQRDYAGSLALAKHLSKPVFSQYKYALRARNLAGQLEKRGEDFKTFTLPMPEEWKRLQEKLGRAEQIDYLAARLRLLNCRQHGQPGGVEYEDAQFRKPLNEVKRGDKPDAINPVVELENLKLTVADLVTLVPYLADENYMPTFSYWRDFHPDRTLHMVNWVVANLVNQAARRDLADLGEYFRLDDKGKKEHVAKVLEWCKANANKTTEQLLLDTLAATKKRDEFLGAAQELVVGKNLKALPILVRRAGESKALRGNIAELCHRLDSAETATAAREWVRVADETTVFWSSLILIRHGDRKKQEGLVSLKKILEKDDGSHFYPRAIDALLASKEPAAAELAAGILKKERLDSFNRLPILHRLFLAGRPETLDLLLRELDDPKEESMTSGEFKGQKVMRTLSKGDVLARELTEWKNDGSEFAALAPDEERKVQRAELKKWLQDQFGLIKAGKTPQMKTKPRALHFPEWRVDAP